MTLTPDLIRKQLLLIANQAAWENAKFSYLSHWVFLWLCPTNGSGVSALNFQHPQYIKTPLINSLGDNELLNALWNNYCQWWWPFAAVTSCNQSQLWNVWLPTEGVWNKTEIFSYHYFKLPGRSSCILEIWVRIQSPADVISLLMFFFSFYSSQQQVTLKTTLFLVSCYLTWVPVTSEGDLLKVNAWKSISVCQ